MIKEFLKLSDIEKENIILKYSQISNIKFDIIEKDIWVCHVLQTIFSDNNLKDKMIFKGGTCLSKVYNVIDRFSEDIDLAIDKSCLKIEGTSLRPEKLSHQTITASREFVKDFIYPALCRSFSESLGDKNWSLEMSDNDKDVIMFNFPSVLKDANNYSYIKPNIQIEFKALSDTWPSKSSSVKPYISEILPQMFLESKVRAIDIRRNFIEKLFILDSITKRPEDRPIKQDRFSRHYYDVYAIIKSGLVNNIKESTHIFESAINNRKIFPRTSWVNYDEIKDISDLKLIPNFNKIEAVRRDYKDMKVMFFKEKQPSFDDMLKEILVFSNSNKILQNQSLKL